MRSGRADAARGAARGVLPLGGGTVAGRLWRILPAAGGSPGGPMGEMLVLLNVQSSVSSSYIPRPAMPPWRNCSASTERREGWRGGGRGEERAGQRVGQKETCSGVAFLSVTSSRSRSKAAGLAPRSLESQAVSTPNARGWESLSLYDSCALGSCQTTIYKSAYKSPNGSGPQVALSHCGVWQPVLLPVLLQTERLTWMAASPGLLVCSSGWSSDNLRASSGK